MSLTAEEKLVAHEDKPERCPCCKSSKIKLCESISGEAFWQCESCECEMPIDA